MDVDDLASPAFMIRDLDRHPHHPDSPLQQLQSRKYQTHDANAINAQRIHALPTPGPTPEAQRTAMSSLAPVVRSESDLSSYMSSVTSFSDAPSAGSAGLAKSSSFTLPGLFKWRKATAAATHDAQLASPESVMETPPDAPVSATDAYFALGDAKMAHLQNQLAHSQQTLARSAEQELQEERRRRHLAEDRLAAVEEEITRLCTVMLPSDSGETGEAYFASILASVRIAIDAYEDRTKQLTEQAEQRAAALAKEQRRTLDLEIENTALREQLKEATASLQENQVLRADKEQLARQLDAAPKQTEELLQRIKDTEAQRDALRQISRSLRQRLTHETRRYEEKLSQAQGRGGSYTHQRHGSNASNTSLRPMQARTRPSGQNTPSRGSTFVEDNGCLPLELDGAFRNKLSLHRPKASVGTLKPVQQAWTLASLKAHEQEVAALVVATI